MVNPLDYINRIILELRIKIQKNNIRNNCHFLLRSHDKYRVTRFVRLRYIHIIRTDESTARNDSVGERWNENGEGIEGGRDPRVES